MPNPLGQNEDGTLKPPVGHETSEIPLEGLANHKNGDAPTGCTNPDHPLCNHGAVQAPMKMLTMDEADLLRAERAFTNHPQTHANLLIFTDLHNMALDFTDLILKKCPAGKERSQALGSLQQCVQWAKASIENK